MIKITLTTALLEDARISKSKIRKRKCIFFGLSFAYIIIINGYYVMLNLNEKDYIGILEPLFIAARLLKVVMDFYIEILFIFVLVFFIKYRK